MLDSQVIEIDGKTLTIETGLLAGQADGAVTVRLGDAVILVTAVCSHQLRENIDFFPLTVDYEERHYAAGRIPGSFFRREGRPTTDAVLTARLVDRPIRPLFPKGVRNEVQVIITVLAVDQENDPDVLAIIGASAALSISDIPFDGPVAGVRIGRIGERFIVNPTYAERDESDLDLVVAGTAEAILMVEAGADQVDERTILEGIEVATRAIREIVANQTQFAGRVGRPKRELAFRKTDPAAIASVSSFLGDRLERAVRVSGTKHERAAAIDTLRQETRTKFAEQYPDAVVDAFEAELKRCVRGAILREGLRPDGRDVKAIRAIQSDAGVLPRTHGSGLFSRGETQVLTVATLGSKGDAQRLDTLEPSPSKRLMHHYNFPPFSTGETGRVGTPKRRELGHGALAERALEPIIPDEDEFPYTIRLVSEVLSSNGSSSMASVCASTLALMDAGVPILAPVSGVAMGLVLGENGEYKVLTDIAGIEDHLGDMDFKVAGTAEGINALQMDIKVKGVTIAIMREALAQANEARAIILGQMLQAISEPRDTLSPYAPRIFRINIDASKIGAVIGPGGRVIRAMVEETGCAIDIEDDGSVYIGAPNDESAQRAIAMIEGLTREVEVGQIYSGRVTRLMNFGAFVEVLPGKDALVHISELSMERVPSVEDAVEVGDEVTVMITEIDGMGRVNASIRAVLAGESPAEAASRSRPSGRGPGGPGGPGGRGPGGPPNGRGGPGGGRPGQFSSPRPQEGGDGGEPRRRQRRRAGD